MRAPACTRTHARPRSPLPRLRSAGWTPAPPAAPHPGRPQPADGWGEAVPAPAGEASVDFEKSGLGWQEGRREAAWLGEGRAGLSQGGWQGGGAVGGFRVDFE